MRWLFWVSVACTFAKQPLVAPPNDVTTVLLVTGTLGRPLDGIARHPWLAVRRKGAQMWQLYEVPSVATESDPFDRGHDYGNPILHAVWRGDEADRAADCIEHEAEPIIRDIDDHYIFYPGPNSNTFGDRILRKCGLHASLPSTSIGKDWRGLIGAGVTSEGTGVQVETPIVGLKIGLKEGIELHVIGLSIGVDFWPPAIILPLGPGRLGFADR
ncbi:MAG TPA: DUF3750 domain-containing protein [Kofleriaceae bacterium]|jgi:hypothetical protein